VPGCRLIQLDSGEPIRHLVTSLEFPSFGISKIPMQGFGSQVSDKNKRRWSAD
jgi:hypothetical protein